MRSRFLALAVVGLVALASCNRDTLAPVTQQTDGSELIPDYAASPAAVIDGAGIGASMFPDELRLTADQKAQIAALHEAFMQASAADVNALRALEQELKAARQRGANREQLRSIFQRAHVIQQRLAQRFAALQEAIWAIYTPAQRAWIETHRPKVCGPIGPPALTDAQIQQIRSLRDAFQAAIAADLRTIKQAHEQARAAYQAGKPKSEIQAILATAEDAMARIRAAERKLAEEILAVLTPEQRARWCVVRALTQPRHP